MSCRSGTFNNGDLSHISSGVACSCLTNSGRPVPGKTSFIVPLEALIAAAPSIDLDGSLTWLRGENKQDNEPLHQMPAPELTLGMGQQFHPGFNWHGQVRAVAKQDRLRHREHLADGDIFSPGKGLIAKLEGNF